MFVNRARVVIFGGMIQHPSGWRQMATEVWNQPGAGESGGGVEAYVAQLPGRYERAGGVAYSHVRDIVAGTLDWLEQQQQQWGAGEVEGTAAPIPYYLLGYSFGCALAYECCRAAGGRAGLQCPGRLVLVSAPSRRDLEGVFLCSNSPESFGTALTLNLGACAVLLLFCMYVCMYVCMYMYVGGIPRVYEEFLRTHAHNPELIAQVLAWAVEGESVECIMILVLCVCGADQEYQQQWCAVYDECTPRDRQLPCGITCITGEQDSAVTPADWATLAGGGSGSGSGSGSFDSLMYPGNHFFIFDSVEVDTRIAGDIRRVMLGGQ